MVHWSLRYAIAVSCSFAVLFIAGYSFAGNERCTLVRQTVEEKRRLIGEYTSALQNAYNQKDFTIAEVLNFKINELRSQVKELEKILTDCPKPKPRTADEGLTPAKSDKATYSNKSCAELRKSLLTLVRRIHTLTRRKKSLLSSLSAEEEVELTEASRALKKVERAIKNKCSKRRGSGRRLRRLNR